MPEATKKESIIGRSPTGNAVISFENETMMQGWIDKNQSHRIIFYKQVITEELIPLNLK